MFATTGSTKAPHHQHHRRNPKPTARTQVAQQSSAQPALLPYAPNMPSNNTNGNTTLTPFTKETASAAGKKSAENRRARATARRAADAITNRKLDEWCATYERDRLGEVAAATAQKLCDDILCGRIEVDARSAAALLPALVDIARIEAGLHTSATMHANVAMTDPMERIREIRARAQTNVLEVGTDSNTTDES